MSKRLWSFGIVLTIFALLLGGCNFQRGTWLANPPAGSLSVGIVKPGSDAYTNTGEIEVKVSATSGKVEDVQVSYEGPQTGIVSLTPSGSVWRGTLPGSLPSGSYVLRARAKSGGLEGASPPVSFTLDREKPEVAILAPSSSILLSGPSLKVRARDRDALSGIKTVTLFANATRLNVNSV